MVVIDKHICVTHYGCRYVRFYEIQSGDCQPTGLQPELNDPRGMALLKSAGNTFNLVIIDTGTEA